MLDCNGRILQTLHMSIMEREPERMYVDTSDVVVLSRDLSEQFDQRTHMDGYMSSFGLHIYCVIN